MAEQNKGTIAATNKEYSTEKGCQMRWTRWGIARQRVTEDTTTKHNTQYYSGSSKRALCLAVFKSRKYLAGRNRSVATKKR